MKHSAPEIKMYNDGYKAQVLDVWASSVQATHEFLSPSDFETIKTVVTNIDFIYLNIYCMVYKSKIVAFIAVVEGKVEMLFVSPLYIGKGIGKTLMKFAMVELGANKVDVNEQNVKALNFYEKLGFEIASRTAKDGLGMKYPILQMKLKQA